MKKGLKIFFGVISAVILFFAIIIIVQVVKELKQEKILIKEVNILYDLDWNKEEVDMHIKTIDDYGRLEKIIKTYYRDLYKYRKEYDKIKSEESVHDILSIENIKKDMLEKSKVLLIDEQKKSNDLVNKILNLIDNDNILKIIENKKLDDYYIDLYKELMLADDDQKLKQSWLDLKENDDQNYRLGNEALDILINNKNIWYIDNDTLYFTNNELLIKYNKILDSLEKDEGIKVENM